MGGPYSESYHRECRDQGHAMTGVMSTLSSVVLTVHLIMNIINANNNNNNVSDSNWIVVMCRVYPNPKT